MNDALLACAEGRWEEAERKFVGLVRRDGEAYVVSPLLLHIQLALQSFI